MWTVDGHHYLRVAAYRPSAPVGRSRGPCVPHGHPGWGTTSNNTSGHSMCFPSPLLTDHCCKRLADKLLGHRLAFKQDSHELSPSSWSLILIQENIGQLNTLSWQDKQRHLKKNLHYLDMWNLTNGLAACPFIRNIWHLWKRLICALANSYQHHHWW